MINRDNDDYIPDSEYDISRSDEEVKQLIGVWGAACLVFAGCYYAFGPFLAGLIAAVVAVPGAGFVYLWLWGSDDACRSMYEFCWNLGRPRKSHWLRR